MMVAAGVVQEAAQDLDGCIAGDSSATRSTLANSPRVVSLASGSSGNAYLIETSSTAIVVDAGMPAIRLRNYLLAVKVSLKKIAAIVVTHDHHDHMSGAAALAHTLRVPVYGTTDTLSKLSSRRAEREACVPNRAFRIGDFSLTPFAVPHDARDAVGYLIEGNGYRIGLAVDLGHVPASVQDFLNQADLVILDCNHDLGKLHGGPYPRALKQRIVSADGHLSNDQAGACIAECLAHRPRSFWLAHLSKENNSGPLALRAVRGHTGAGESDLDVRVALRDRPSISWHAGAEKWKQGVLF
jgi:phosphoribosyl 1,2-cyclic phosphodiesterase